MAIIGPKPAYLTDMKCPATRSTMFLWMFLAICGCSRESEETRAKSAQPQATTEDRTDALVRQYNFPLLSKELQKAVGTNTVYSIDIQRVLAGNRGIVASGTLHDIVEAEDGSKPCLNSTTGIWCLGKEHV